MQTRWFDVTNVEEIASPALLVYPEQVQENIRRMIAIAGGPDRLRPHIKTHKLPEVVRMQLHQGINRFKAATIAEIEMAAACGAPDVLLAYPAVGPNIQRLIELMRRYPQTTFSALADDAAVIHHLSQALSKAGLHLNLMLDVDCGMHRTGVLPGDHSVELYQMISKLD